jgi:hypothetical protein
VAVASPRKTFRGLRQVPLEWEDDQLILLARAVQQLQERSRQHPVEVVTVTSSYTVLDPDLLILANASSGDVTVTLQTAAGRERRRVIVKKTDTSSNLVIIDPDGSETIDGSSTISLTQKNAVREMMSDGTNWRLISALGNATAL